MILDLSSVLSLLAAVIAGCAEVTGPGNDASTSARGAPSSATPSSDSRSAVLGAARMWASFPAATSPRPIILLSPEALGPQAFAAIALTDYNFPTDRGPHSLPAWRMHLRDVTGDSYVLAVSPPSARYELPSEAGMYDAGRAVPSADGRRLTINFIAHHDSTGPCDPGYSSSLRVAQTPTAIVLAVTIAFEPETPPPNVACPASGASAIVPAPPIPGAPGTRTITLAEPLGGRVVVDDRGTPYVVSAH